MSDPAAIETEIIAGAVAAVEQAAIEEQAAIAERAELASAVLGIAEAKLDDDKQRDLDQWKTSIELRLQEMQSQLQASISETVLPMLADMTQRLSLANADALENLKAELKPPILEAPLTPPILEAAAPEAMQAPPEEPDAAENAPPKKKRRFL